MTTECKKELTLEKKWKISYTSCQDGYRLVTKSTISQRNLLISSYPSRLYRIPILQNQPLQQSYEL